MHALDRTLLEFGFFQDIHCRIKLLLHVESAAKKYRSNSLAVLLSEPAGEAQTLEMHGDTRFIFISCTFAFFALSIPSPCAPRRPPPPPPGRRFPISYARGGSREKRERRKGEG